MILLLDAGNTRIKWRVFDEAVTIAISDGDSPRENPDFLTTLLQTHPNIGRIVGTNVAGQAVADALARQAEAFGLTPQWLTPERHCAGVSNLYTNPAQLGADRWAALIGARHIHPGACLVVMAGTATTMDLLDVDGQFLGGLILPGIAMMQRALHSNTAGLPIVEGAYASLPRSTEDAIHSGILHAHLGAMARMFDMIRHQPSALCLIGGGAANHLIPLLDLPSLQVDNLVLAGLEALVKNKIFQKDAK